IADTAGVQSLGGVIGGEATGCSEATTEIFIEAALFDPIRTAATGRKLNIASDARYRFERGLDPSFVQDGLEIATRLVLDLGVGDRHGRGGTGLATTLSAPHRTYGDARGPSRAA